MELKVGNRSFEPNGRYLTLDLPVSCRWREHSAELRQRLATDGFLYIRRFHSPPAVLTVRRDILLQLSARGQLAEDAPLMEGVIHPSLLSESATVPSHDVRTSDLLVDILFGPRTIGFFTKLMGAQAQALGVQYVQVEGGGMASPVYNVAATVDCGPRQHYTFWTPLGQIAPEMGALALCLGSHRWKKELHDSRHAVDGKSTTGVADDLAELVDRFGGRWATTTFEPGDVVIMSGEIIHTCLTNLTNRYRLTSHTRYQSATDRSSHPIAWSAELPLNPAETLRRHDEYDS